ncbi:MAG: manganese catalase family protein, partial [Oscillospiraceae bacterium]|nr:manganese catalase family protein [Oscillospiraceae bacterium]
MAIQSGAPYPPPRVQCPNPAYAEMMLSNIGSANSEMSSAAQYFYAHLMSRPVDKDLSNLFRKVSIVEMHHLDLFGELALQLGAEPRLWHCRGGRKEYWSPCHINYAHCTVEDLVRAALEAEYAAIRKYECQLERIADPHIAALLRRVIEDER